MESKVSTSRFKGIPFIFLCTFLIFGPCSVIGQMAEDRRCHSYESSCSSCIQTPGCQWCSAFVGNSSSRHRCYSSSSISSNVCQASGVVNPQNEHQVLENRPLTEVKKGRSTDEEIVQLAPQRMRLRLRKGEPYNITFRFRLATDYPVDLYYLMDLSKSMEDDKENLARLGSSLAATMRNLTSKFKLGFGSYVDKVVMPFANVHPKRVLEPCAGCAKPYSFRNNLPLDSDDRKFTEYVRKTPISGNVDAPEGGLDALMQAIVCWDQIGWRRQARRLLILSTDATFHHAGDGRLAGIIEPHDGLCHLNDQGEYTHFDRLDYPSISQINKAAKDNQVNIIFAVSKYGELYEALSAQVAYSSQGMLDSRSSNVVALVRDQYNRISSEVKLTDTVSGEAGAAVSVRYFSSCLGGGPTLPTASCRGIKEGDEVEFIAQITAEHVPQDPRQRALTVNVTTFQDRLTLEVLLVAECDCEAEGAPGRQLQAPQCSDIGTLQCGVCQCPDGHYGNQCQCGTDGTRDTDDSSDSAQCHADPAEAELCSGRGMCECGACICNSESLSGKYCECNSDHCNTGGGEQCSGRGECYCGVCQCHQGYTGKFCECPDHQTCVMPGTGEVCSGQGNCTCGVCSCYSVNDVLYTGRYCEECPTCASGKCRELRDCVQCRVFRTGRLAGDACANCTVRPRVLSNLDAQVEAGARLCTFVDETTGCDFNFTYEYRRSSQDYFVFAQELQLCPEQLDVLGVVLGVIGAVVAIGLLTLLLWKVLTTIHDRREFARFEAERSKAQWATTESPYYKPATGTFVNPAFGSSVKH